MERILHYDLTSDNEGYKISQYLRHLGYTGQNLTELKKMPESILLNGEPCYMNRILSAGDVLTVHIQETGVSEQVVPVNLPLSIIYEDEDILVVDKPAGMPIHPSMNNYTNSLANALAWYYKEQGKPFIFRCTNRLDRDTSGLTVIAKHMVSSGILAGNVTRHDIQREYLAIVSGHVTPPEGRIEAPLGRKDGSIIERTVDWENGEYAATNYRVVKYLKDHTLISLRLETGRTHQIRIHMKYLGYPLIGDYLYNPDMRYISRQALHSARLSFVHPMTKEAMTFEAPLPEDMQHAVDVLSG